MVKVYSHMSCEVNVKIKKSKSNHQTHTTLNHREAVTGFRVMHLILMHNSILLLQTLVLARPMMFFPNFGVDTSQTYP